MKKVRVFTDLLVWQKGHKLFLDTVNDLDKLGSTLVEREIVGQLLRSVGSITANIAEGFNARSTKEYLHYLDIAQRTTHESENWFYKLRDLGYMRAQIADERIYKCIGIAKMLQGLISKLEKTII